MYKQQVAFGEIRASAKKKKKKKEAAAAIVRARLRLDNAPSFVVNSKHITIASAAHWGKRLC